MADELLIADVVHAFAEHLLPGNEAAARRAVTAAVGCHFRGASASEACRAGRRMLESQARHPSLCCERSDGMLAEAR